MKEDFKFSKEEESEVPKSKYFDVEAAGKIQIGEHASCVTASTAGFSFGVEWSKYPFVGGVLSRTEAKRLAEYILSTLEKCTDTEEECVEKCYKALETKTT